MAPPIGYKLWLWFQSNPIAQGIALAVAVFAGFRMWLGLRDRRVMREIEDKIEKKAEASARSVSRKTKEKTDEVIRESEAARAGIPRGTPSGELPDDIQSILFDD